MDGIIACLDLMGRVILACLAGVLVHVVVRRVWPDPREKRTRDEWKQDLVDYMAHKLPPLRDCTNREKPPFEFYLPREVCDALQAINALHSVLSEIEHSEADLVILYTRNHLYKVVFLGATRRPDGDL